MIVIKIMGGLGNQLFQYALGRHLSLIHGRQLKLDISGYTDTKPDPKLGVRVFGLNAFSGEWQPASKADLDCFEIYHRAGTVGRVARLVNAWKPYSRRAYILEPPAEYWHFQPSILTSALASPVYMSGYWQSSKYFESIAGTIRKDLMVQQPPEGQNAEMLSIMGKVESVAVHVRHGDNAAGLVKDFGVLSVSYYEQAANEIARRLGSPHFFVFSDDPVWAKENVRLPGAATVVDHNGDERNYEDLRLMAGCRHHITGNSTFSWWGAWLARHDEQIVYAPEKYYMHLDRDFRDYYPSSWKLLPAAC